MTTSNSRPCRVVVADDNQMFRMSLVRFLGTLPNIEVVAEAADGQEALQCVETTAPHLLLLDMRMPVMDGLEVLRRLQAAATSVQVVVLSAHEDGYAMQALASGATAFVRKGDIPQLVTTLTQVSQEC
jgi:CheY-like chemotaxis protein